MFEEYGDLLTPEECMEAIGCGRNAIYAALASGELKGLRMGSRKWKIPRESLVLYIRTKANLL